MKKKIPVVLAALVSAASLFCFSASAESSSQKLTTLSSVVLSNYTSATDTPLSFLNISRESEYWDYRVSIPALSASRKYRLIFETDSLPLAGGYQYTITIKANIRGTGSLTPLLLLDDDSVLRLPAIQYTASDHLDYYTFETTPDKNVSVVGFAFDLTGWTASAGSGHVRYYEVKGLNSSGQILDEDFGYEKPASPNTDEGLDAGGNLLDEMTDTVDEFNATVNEKTQVMIDNVTKVKPLVDGVFDIIPLPITLCVSGVVVFLVIRKVVGR